MKKSLYKILCISLVALMCLGCTLSASAEVPPDYYYSVFEARFNEYTERCEEILGFPYEGNRFYYAELYHHWDSNFATPDYVLVNTNNTTMTDTYSYRFAFGDYIYGYNLDNGYFIYLPNEDITYTIAEAYKNDVPGIEHAIDYLYGEHIVKAGDANGDKVLNIKDATYIQYISADRQMCLNSLPYNNILFEDICDMNCDHQVNVKDATYIQKLLAKLIHPTVYDKTPASADSVEYTEVISSFYNDHYNYAALVTDYKQWVSVKSNVEVKYTDEFFEEKALVYINRNFYSGMVHFYTDGVYKEGDTLYVKCREEHPAFGMAHTCDIGVYQATLEIDKELLEGVDKLCVDIDAYNIPW